MKKWMPLFVLSLAAFMLALDSATLSVSIAQLVTEFNTTVVGIQRVVTYTSLIMASLMLVGGKLGDIFGRRRVFAIGLTLFTIWYVSRTLTHTSCSKRTISRNCSTASEGGSEQVALGPPERIRTQPAVLRLRAFGTAVKIG